MIRRTTIPTLIAAVALPIAALAFAAPPAWAAAAPPPAAPGATQTAAVRDTARASGAEDYSLRAGQDGTVFRSLTVEGEDRVHFEFERPALALELDATRAPGLDWGSARDVLDRTVPDLTAPLLAHSARETSPYPGHPWLGRFPTGAVARFRPDLEGVERWALTVVDARGETVTSYQGKGAPPREIAWDGRSQRGATVMPGMTYSYVLVAHDRAGNKRSFVGQGFRVSAYRRVTETGVELVFSGRDLAPSEPLRWTAAAAARETPPILIEAASWLNQSPRPAAPVRVTVTARTLDEAQGLAATVTRGIATGLIGGAARLEAVPDVRPDAPEGGAVRIATGT